MSSSNVSQFNRRRLLQASAGLASAVILSASPTTLTNVAAQKLGDKNASGNFSFVTWEGEGEGTKWIDYLKTFLKDNYPGLSLKPDYGIEWAEYWTKLQTSIAGGSAPTLAAMHDSRLQSFASLGLLEPLDDFIAQMAPDGWPDKFYESQVKSFQYQGKQYAIPYDWATGGLYINSDLFNAAGMNIPDENTTFQELLEAALKIKETSSDPKNTFGLNLPIGSGGVDWIVQSFGGQTFTDNPLTAHWDDPKTIEAFQYLYDLIWTHKVMQGPLAIKQTGLSSEFVFVNGQVGASYALNDSAFRMNEAVAGAFNWTVAPTPKGTTGRFQFVGGSSFSVPKGSNFPAISYEAARFIATDPSHLDHTGQIGSMFVSRSDHWEAGLPGKDAGVDLEAYKHTFYTLGLKDGVVPLYHPKFQEWDASIFTPITDRLWTGEDSDVTGVMQEVQAKTVTLLNG